MAVEIGSRGLAGDGQWLKEDQITEIPNSDTGATLTHRDPSVLSEIMLTSIQTLKFVQYDSLIRWSLNAVTVIERNSGSVG